MHYYQHNIGDYRRDTIHLTLLEHGIYRQLLDCYYLSETPLPTETRQVMRKVAARTDEERAIVESVLHEFFQRTPEGWVHARCDREIVAYRERAQRSRDNGKRGGRPVSAALAARAGTQEGITQPVISGLPDETRTKANALTNNSLTQEPNNPITKNKTLGGGSGTAAPPPAPREEKTGPQRLAEDWTLPTEWAQWAAAPPRMLSMTKIEEEAERFRRYWLGKRGREACKTDWCMTWRNWIKRCTTAPGGQKRYPEKFREKFNPLAYINGNTGERDAMEGEFAVIKH